MQIEKIEMEIPAEPKKFNGQSHLSNRNTVELNISEK